MKTLSIAQSVCIEYDEIMLHHRKTHSASHFGDTTDEDVDSNAKTVIFRMQIQFRILFSSFS